MPTSHSRSAACLAGVALAVVGCATAPPQDEGVRIVDRPEMAADCERLESFTVQARASLRGSTWDATGQALAKERAAENPIADTAAMVSSRQLGVRFPPVYEYTVFSYSCFSETTGQGGVRAMGARWTGTAATGGAAPGAAPWGSASLPGNDQSVAVSGAGPSAGENAAVLERAGTPGVDQGGRL